MLKHRRINQFVALVACALAGFQPAMLSAQTEKGSKPQIIYWPPSQNRPANAVGLLYTPEVLAALAARSPRRIAPRIQEAISRQTPIVVMWAIPQGAQPDPYPRPYSAAIVDDVPGGATSWSLKRIDPVWIEQDADELKQLDPDTTFRDVGVMAAFPRSAFVRGRLVTIFCDLPAEPGAHKGVQVFGRIDWSGEL